MRPKLQSRDLDRHIAELAEHQHGVLARRQLLEAGACDRAIGRRIERGRLQIVHRGVFALGHRLLTENGRCMAAVLAGGEQAILSHVSAARLWGLPIGPTTPIHVTAPSQRSSAASDVVFHRGSIPPDEVSEIQGIPVTTTARTLLDLGSCIPLHRLRGLVDEAEYRQLTDVVPLSMLVDRYPGRRGLTAVRAVLAEGIDGSSQTREELEARFREFLIERDIPRPRFNQPMTIGTLRIVADCVWIDQRVIVELDGAAAHSRRANFEADRKRDRRLLVAGWRPTRVTWRQLAHGADELERELRALLVETRVSDG
jgi:very-short-patch-repair endonuclease